MFRLFQFFTKTEIFGVSIEPKQTEEQPKQFDRVHILVFFPENLGLFRFVSVCFGFFRNNLFRLFHFYTETESFDVLIEPKQTENQPKQFILVFFPENLGLFSFFSVCFGLFQNSLFRLFHFYTKTESLDVLIEPKQIEDQLKQFD